MGILVEGKEYYTPQEVAYLFGVDVRVIRRECDNNKIKHIRLSSKKGGRKIHIKEIRKLQRKGVKVHDEVRKPYKKI